MQKKKKVLVAEEIPEFHSSLENLSEESKIFVDKSLEIADHILKLMEQKGLKQKELAERMGKSEAEVSKLLGGMHNYTLRSLAKIEAALGSTIITTPINVKHMFPKGPMLHASYSVQDKRKTLPQKQLEYPKAVKMREAKHNQTATNAV